MLIWFALFLKKELFSPAECEPLSPNNNHNALLPARTIYLAEDDVDDQEFLREALQNIDNTIQVVSFSTGIKFINGLSQAPDEQLPSLIVLDYNIPELNGAEILEQLTRADRYAGIPKVVWSTSDSELYRQNCLSFGASAYLVKPSSISGIAAVAKEMLTYC